jgi:tetratricopeptide (TPR) repeat protein
MPDDKQEISQRISSFLAKGLNAQARAEAENMLRDWPGDAEAFTLAGDVYAWTGAPSAAYRHYNSAADSYNRLGMPDKMLSVHHKILELDATLLDANTQVRIRLLVLLVAAEDALAAARYEQAVASYQEAIRQFPNHTVTYQRLASLYSRLGRPAEAVNQYLTVARAFHQHGVLAKAAPYYERVLEIEPTHGEALGGLVAFLQKEGRAAEAERPIKAAVQEFLERGDADAAGDWFDKLPDDLQQDVTPLRAALLLQRGDSNQAEDAAKMLELGRSEVSEWFKRMGRAALDRGDSVTADTYFRWASPAPPAQAPAPAPAAAAFAMPPPVAPPPPQPPQAMQAPASAAPPPPPPPQPLSQPAPPPPAPAIAASPAAQAVNPGEVGVKAEDDRVVLQTMGEMCLAEEMFEEARQVFERLLRAEPGRKAYLELLNKARAGLGLGPVAGPPPAPGAIPAPPPARPQAGPAATALGAPAFAGPPSALPPPPPIQPAPGSVVRRPEIDPSPIRKAVEFKNEGPQVQQPILEWARPEAPYQALGTEAPAAPKPPTPAAPPPAPLAPPPPPAAIVPAPAPAVPAPPPPVLAPPPPRPVPAPPPRPSVAVPSGPPPAALAPPPPPAALPAPPRPVPAPQPRRPAPERVPALSGVSSGTPSGSKIVRTAHVTPLGELPPATPTNLDYDDDIIE